MCPKQSMLPFLLRLVRVVSLLAGLKSRALTLAKMTDDKLL